MNRHQQIALEHHCRLAEETLHPRLAIKGVGDSRLGEWEEFTGFGFHIRRRLSVKEQQSVGPVVDIRGTPDETHRLAVVARWVR